MTDGWMVQVPCCMEPRSVQVCAMWHMLPLLYMSESVSGNDIASRIDSHPYGNVPSRYWVAGLVSLRDGRVQPFSTARDDLRAAGG